jgi:hypothetical protein
VLHTAQQRPGGWPALITIYFPQGSHSAIEPRLMVGTRSDRGGQVLNTTPTSQVVFIDQQWSGSQ